MELLLAVLLVELFTAGGVSAAVADGAAGAWDAVRAGAPARRAARDGRRQATRWGRLTIRVRDGVGAPLADGVKGAAAGARHGLARAKVRRRHVRQVVTGWVKGGPVTPVTPVTPSPSPSPSREGPDPSPPDGPSPAAPPARHARPPGEGPPALTLITTQPEETVMATASTTDTGKSPAVIAAWSQLAEAVTLQAEYDQASGHAIPGLGDLVEHVTAYCAGVRQEFAAAVEAAEGTRAQVLAAHRDA